MLARIASGTVVGLDPHLIEVEVDIPNEGLPRFNIVGLPDKAVEESKERVRSAIKNSGASFPEGRITVNLAPADIPKAGPAYDLPIALGILIASGQISSEIPAGLFVGELSLDGSLKSTNGILPMAKLAESLDIPQLYVPLDNKREAAVVKNISVYGISSLLELIRVFNKTNEIKPAESVSLSEILTNAEAPFDFAEIIGQEQVKRAMEIAAAGSHNIFLKGTPGSGKTMIARALSGILPVMTEDEALEVTKIYSITGNLKSDQALITSRPFRSPHHTTSRIGLIGGGSNPTPGEVSLAHRGVLFLDEFPEFPRSVLESLRQPLEDGMVTISRARASVSYPARFLMVAAANPCPCGYYGDKKRVCKCMPGLVARYQKRISGPILDRIDLHITVPSVDTEKLIGQSNYKSESSRTIQKRVQDSRNLQTNRFKNCTITSNSEMNTRQVKEFCELSRDCLVMLRSAVTNLDLSARSYFKVVKVARTIADLAGEEIIATNHIAEALQYRPKESPF